MARCKIGFLINPISGMGGSVGLKGTDGVLDLAKERGASPVAHIKAEQALENLDTPEATVFLTAAGNMGESVLKSAGITYRVIYEPPLVTSAGDTEKICRLFLDEKVDLILFCGGDGTARDVYSVVQERIPVLGIPAGVKMYSGVFALNPASARELLKAFFGGKTIMGESEILDIDEEKYREGVLDIRLFGYAKTPQMPGLIQEGKAIIHDASEEISKAEIAWFLSEIMKDDSIYILGPGTTTKAICDLLGLPKTLLGVDAVKNQKIVGVDLNESEILDLIDGEDKVTIIVSPLGRQGAILGRGNQQISARVIRKVGVENIIVVATPQKLRDLPFLFVDTGDRALDSELSGYISVVCGYRMAQRKKVLR
ncbi:MAG: ATP-NAD kinase [Candidatus Syntrophoarchaeum caldarius]|uniref:ATP-NAD kinase n=1 Tax=Candidatus Syntropharchaeum caldarium TaxID=1838285 RepID=A0A1F2PAU0_9EURY|nr:MAG: ATP-NAD kinase [Candidatus Syntrophoarchaeum caldarius]